MADKVSIEGRQAYQASLGGDEKARASLYVRKMKAKSGGYEYEYKVETTKHPFLLRILHIFKAISTKYYHGEDAIDFINNEDRLRSKMIEPKKPEEKQPPPDTEEQTKEGKKDVKKPVVIPVPVKEPQKEEIFDLVKKPQKEEVEKPVLPVTKEPEVKKPVNVPVLKDSAKKKEDEDEFPVYNPKDYEDVVPASEPPGIKTAPNIPKDRKLETYSTVGDGSCGVHALLGEVDERGHYRCDAKAVRQEYAEWLRQKMQNKEEMPMRINTVLTDYFLHFKDAPGGFFNNPAAISARQDLYPDNYSSLTHEEQDNLQLIWLNDPEVLNTYINFLEDPSNDLRHDELLGFGEYFKKTVYFVCRNQWGNPEMIEGFENPSIEGEGPPVYIWYVPNIHFERATYTKI